MSFWINSKWKYDVFLSFHGAETRLNFVGFLRQSLLQRGIRVFYDDDSIRTGDEITPALFQGIQESRIAIIVFSENYATSTFCLQELAQILNCFKEEGRLVYPVFYYVDPSELRRPKGSYAQALALREERFKDDKQKVASWRLALSQAADLKGWHVQSGITNEQECITNIIIEVSARINYNHSPMYVNDYPVGVMSRVKEVISRLDLWSSMENKMVGIVGPGGVGKSTIARALYNSIGDHFEGLCFLSDVRQKSKEPNGLEHLQETLLCKLVMVKDLKLDDFYEGITIIQSRLGKKKILLILDDVDDLGQIKALAGSCDWFGRGSRIVITTRNKQLLVNMDVLANYIYNVTELNNEESLQLLCWYAFKTENVEPDFKEVSERAIKYCCGFPLALQVIGSNLRGKGVKDWPSALDQFKRSPEESVLSVLRSSYDSLSETEKSIFLDLACFFKGEELGEVKDMLLCLHETQPEYAIGVLVDKSLIQMEGNRVLMHDLIEDMGKEIVQNESRNEPGERSRLWFYQDIVRVLERETGTNKVEVIVLDLPEGNEEAQIQWSGEAFRKMKNLKMLVIKNASFSKCPIHLPNSLRWLKWKGYPLKFLPYNSSTELIYLDLSCSYFDILQPFTKNFRSLSRMNFRNCKSLQQIPDLSGVSNLRELWLDGCTNLVKIHHSAGCLNKLKELSAMRCTKLKILPPNLRLTSLEHLNLFGCSSLISFPNISVEMKCMRTLDLGRTAITTLSSSVCNFTGLETINMEECSRLEQLSTVIFQLPNLWALNATFSRVMTGFKMCGGGAGGEENLDCDAVSLKLEHFCFSNCNLSDESLALCLSYFTNMIHLDLSFNRFTTLPACIKECHHLKYLLLDHCNQLQHIEEMPPNLEQFSATCCMSMTKFSESTILNQALNLQPGKRYFVFPGGKFPEKLDRYSTESCVSFWVRDAFPTIFLWILVKEDQDFLSNCSFQVHVNDIKLDISYEWLLLTTMKMGHLCICDLQSMIPKTELLHGYKWDHVKVSMKSKNQGIKSGKDQFHMGLHVYQQQNNRETIQFMDPKSISTSSILCQRAEQPKDWEALDEADMPYQDMAPSVVSQLKAQSLELEESLTAERAALPSQWTYDVLLSYKGGDDGCTNFVSLLSNSLWKRRIRLFLDHDDELANTNGEGMKAVKESRTAIIVISKNYASLPSNLDSLAIILEQFKVDCRFICPIFYDVDPSELKYQAGNYGKLFDGFKKRFNEKRVQKWRLALLEATESVPFVIGSHRYETVVENAIKRITDEVSAITDAFPMHNYLIPPEDSEMFESRVQEVISVVDVGSNKEVKMVGICGDLRIDTRAILFVVCNYIARHFEDLWYFDVCQEITRGSRYSSLTDFLNYGKRQPMLSQKKTLIILYGFIMPDCLQLRAVRESDRLGEGSRIIVATGNKQLVERAEIVVALTEKKSSGIEIILNMTSEKSQVINMNVAPSVVKLKAQLSQDLMAERAALPSQWTYDVLLSYKGGDDKCTNFVSLLSNSLWKRRIRLFLDHEDELANTNGEEMKAVKESRTAIIVISKNYASSPSSLDSLAIILERFKVERRFICPIFYDVDPSGSYGKLFDGFKKRFNEKRRLALREAARSVSFVIQSHSFLLWNRTEIENTIKRITDQVSAITDAFPMYNCIFPLEDSEMFESRVQEVISVVDVGSNEEVKMVGICGDLGIDTKAILFAVCNSIARHFEDLWYFYMDQEIARGKKYSSLIDFLNYGKRQPMLSQKKTLIILYNEVKMLDDLQIRAVRESDRLGKGSRIIVATDDKQLLESAEIEIILNMTSEKSQVINMNVAPRERGKTQRRKSIKFKKRIRGIFKWSRRS